MDVDVFLVYALNGERALVGNEVDVVTPLGELNAKPRGEYSTAADTGVTGYAYLRARCPLTNRVTR